VQQSYRSKLVIVRHAERPEILGGTVGNELTLTAKGIADTIAFSSSYHRPKVVSIRTSPVVRCVQTAQIIADTLSFPLSQIQQCKLLGDPGFFIEDSELAWQNWLEKGSEAVNLHLLSGQEKWSGFFEFDEAISKMRSFIKNSLIDGDSGTHIWVTHDTILATLASRLLPFPLSVNEWPKYLGYLEINLDVGGDMEMLYRPCNLNLKN